MRTKLMEKLNRNLNEKENSSQCLKILTQITVEDENELQKERLSQNNQRASPSTVTRNLP